MKKEVAIKVNNPYPWCGGAPCPLVVADDLKLFLMYYMKESLYKPTGQSMNITLDMPDNIGVVTFKRAYAHKLEGINDEVIGYHPYFKKNESLGYDIFIIENSKWIKEIIKINSNHRYHKDSYYSKYKHYFFVFHDSMFQCIAEDFTIEKVTLSYNEVSQLLFNRLLNDETKKIQF